ncbi:MAG: DUF1552 domain-containing protein [Akkermansiaceae bacterium]
MINRRDFLRRSLLSAGALGLSSNPLWAKATVGQKHPMRFIFIHKGNGLFPHAMVPKTFDKDLMAKEKARAPYEASLKDHDLQDWMGALNEHKDNMTILQGLSGKMCTVGHHSFQSSLGVYKANQRLSSIKWATVDFELANLFPSPLQHIELACFPSGGGNSRGNINGIEKGFSARGPQQPNYAFGSPKIAIKKLFKSVANSKDAQVQYELERRVLEFAAGNQASLSEALKGIEKAKVKNYADSIEAVRERNKKIDAMGDVIRKHVPQLDDKYFADDLSTIDRQVGHTEVLLSTLISGMTNVATFTIDELGTPYTGVTDIEKETINLHDVGHGKSVGAFDAVTVREKVRRHHMDVVDSIVKRLKSVPEGTGTMFDNTMIFYYPDGGETHHSKGTEFPFIVLSGKNSKLNIAGKYIRLPYYGKEGHKTLGNWYTSILNAYGNDIEHYGDPDTGLSHLNQKGPIKEFMG